MDYITNETSIIFSPYYDGQLDSELTSQYKKIIFSDYELTDGIFETYENDKFCVFPACVLEM